MGHHYYWEEANLLKANRVLKESDDSKAGCRVLLRILTLEALDLVVPVTPIPPGRKLDWY